MERRLGVRPQDDVARPGDRFGGDAERQLRRERTGWGGWSTAH